MSWKQADRWFMWLLWGFILAGWMWLAAGCTLRQAQVATQTSLTAVADGVNTGAEVFVEELPQLSKTAIAEAEEACPDPCSSEAFVPYLDAKLAPLHNASKGLKLAKGACEIAQGAQNVWVATGKLPDTDPLCQALGDAVRPVPALLTDAGVKGIPPEVEALAGPATQIVCETVSRWAKEQ